MRLGLYTLRNYIVLSQDGDDGDDYYSSVAGLEKLLNTEQILLADLKYYIETTKQSIEVLEKELLKIETEHQTAANDVENYLTNPVNAYRLIKRLFNDWHKYESHLENAKGIKYHLEQWKLRKSHLHFPSQVDFEESALALVRLQQTYNLDVEQVASGILNGIKYGNDMSWSDCLLLGQQLINVKAFNQTKDWINESMKRYSMEEDVVSDSTESTLDFMEKLGENLLKTGDTTAALEVFRAVVLKDPHRLNVVSAIYNNTYLLPEAYEEEREYHRTEEFKLYEKVCREEVTRSPSEERDLRCRYYWGVDNAFVLSPFKLEEINEDPYVMLLHDMVTDQQIATIKEIAMPEMRRSTVRDDSRGGSKRRNYRISKNAWVEYTRHPHIEKLLRDLHYATGLETQFSEELQVANYGLGGHYEPHVDFYLTGVTEEYTNRISTSIFYLSDVEQGGATAFPYLKIAIKPTKGSVLFWFNLHRSLDGDYRTKHAGCPVLKGSKWIGNVWTHDRTQFAIRPCGLYRDYESSWEYMMVK
ncbi:prolyl 4-hydroxylase subunit alpha-2-like [Musca vetustissima]|uniref:prolyl 4-hydroxylase subunit alpha-2-like n=1 Tax=Musca vetustissima TaxID=27455 RepID=UPI002AB690BA|nr:prolyl 4-hydroxylase subunit alpha-2-like [Musca vetustissima]